METFDTCLFIPKTVRWRLESVVISGGVPTAGAPRLALTDGGGFWTCEMTDVWIRNRAGLKAARAFEARMDGGSVPLLVPDRDAHLGPGTRSWTVDIAMAAPASLRATEVTVQIAIGLPLEGGEQFSIDHPTKGRRLYRVASAEPLVAGEQQITIRPPLREAVSDEVLDFNKPSCTMRLANAAEFFGAIDSGRFSSLSPVFVESF